MGVLSKKPIPKPKKKPVTKKLTPWWMTSFPEGGPLSLKAGVKE